MYCAGSRRTSTAAPSLSAVSSRHRIRLTFCIRSATRIGPWTDPVSVLGLILFLLYTADLLRLVESNHLRPHLYADDTQIYAVCHPTGTTKLLEQMSACIDDVAMWMRSNRLQLNTAKTEVIWCSSSRRQDQIPQVALKVSNDSVMPASSVRDLGIYIDSDVSVADYKTFTNGYCTAKSALFVAAAE